MESATLTTKVGRWCESFVKAAGLGHTQNATTATIAGAMFSHWHQEKFIVFAQEGRMEFSDKETSVPKLTQILDKFIDHGLGLDVRLEKYRVEPVSSSSALCFVTVSVHPPSESKIATFSWENVFLYRVPPGQEDGYFDFGVFDNEFAALLQRVPTFFQDAD